MRASPLKRLEEKCELRSGVNAAQLESLEKTSICAGKSSTSVRPVKDGGKRQEKLGTGAEAGALCQLYKMVSEEQGYPTTGMNSWIECQVLHKVHGRVTHQQKRLNCDKHESNFEDQSRHRCLGKSVLSFS